MSRKQHLMLKQRAVLAVFLLGVFAEVQAANYSNIYFFGDSLTDSGAFGPILGAGRYDRFTTKPGTVWAENLGSNYGKSVTPAYTVMPGPGGVLHFPLDASSNNFALGSALVNSAPPGNPAAANLPPVSAQVTGFLARGAVDSGALYALWAGGNDVFAQFVAGSGATPSLARQTAIATAANDLTAQVTRLQSAGSRKLIVIGLMDTASAPFGLLSSDSDQTQLRNLKTTFDTHLAAGLAGMSVLYFDTGKLISAILDRPLAYGFSNTTGQACAGLSALLCQLPANGFMYADDKHPSDLFHRVVSDWVYSSLEGAGRIGLLSLVPMGRSGAQWRSIDSRLQGFENFGYRGQGFFASSDYASSAKDATAVLPSAEGSGGSFVLGYEKALNEQLFGGATLGYGNAPFALGNNQGSVHYEEWALSAFASHKFGAFYANALSTYSWLNYESRRNVALGAFRSSEEGKTRGRQWGVKGLIGYNFVSGPVVHGPIAGLAWERVSVDGFSEQSTGVSAMSFGQQTRESLRSRLGWQVAAETRWFAVKVRPYAQLTYDYEHKKDERSYSAGFVGGQSSMEMQSSNRTGGYGTLLAGVAGEVNKTLRLGVGASTTIGQPGARNLAINVTLSAPL